MGQLCVGLEAEALKASEDNTYLLNELIRYLRADIQRDVVSVVEDVGMMPLDLLELTREQSRLDDALL